MTQVENGHAGNTAVATAYLCGRNMVTEAAGQEFVLTIIINICFEHLVFICSFCLWGVFWVEESVELIGQSYRKDCRECKPASKIDCRSVVHTVRVL